MVLALPAVGLAAVDGALAGGAGLRDGAVGAVRGSRGGFLVLFVVVVVVVVVFAVLSVRESGGEADGHEKGGAEEGELHGFWEVGFKGR